MVLPKLIVDLTNDSKKCPICNSKLVQPEVSISEYYSCSNPDCKNWNKNVENINVRQEEV